jgi:hypothetical protein
VRLHGRLGQEQPLGDLGVRQALGDREQHLALALGELGEPGVAARRRGGRLARQLLGEQLEHPPGHPRGHDGVSGRDGADGGRELGGARVLEQEAARAGAQGGERVLVQVERGEDEHPGPGAGGDDALGGLDAVRAGHPDVHQHDVGVQGGDLAQGLGPVARLADDGEVVLVVEHQAEAHPQQRLVVHQQDADRRRCGAVGGGGHAGSSVGVAASAGAASAGAGPSGTSSVRSSTCTRQPPRYGPAATEPR